MRLWVRIEIGMMYSRSSQGWSWGKASSQNKVIKGLMLWGGVGVRREKKVSWVEGVQVGVGYEIRGGWLDSLS